MKKLNNKVFQNVYLYINRTMLSNYIRDFFLRRDGEHAIFYTDIGDYKFHYMNEEIASNIKHLKIICTPNYVYPREMTIDKFYNLEILDIVDFEIYYLSDIIENLKHLRELKILRMNYSKSLTFDILPENLEILIIDNICNCNDWAKVLDDLSKEIINFQDIFFLENIPIFTKNIILNLHYGFIEKLNNLDMYNYFNEHFTKYLDIIKIPFGCKIVYNG